MRIGEIVKAANENDVDLMWAVTRRQECLTGRYFDIRMQMKEDAEYLKNQAADDFEARVWSEAMIEASCELQSIRVEQKRLKDWIEQSKSKPVQITDDMIQAAKDTPIETVVRFDRTGKALAFCHADKTPSLSWNRKGNRAHCFPCGRSFNAIDVLIARDGFSFIDAVKELNRDAVERYAGRGTRQ